MFVLNETAFASVTAHAVETYPEECCGVVLAGGGCDEVHPLENIQNRLHKKDPRTFPRDARTAYTIDHQVLESVLAEAAGKGLTFKAVYHSHPDHDAYFSPEDKDFATPFGEPTYPDVAQVVISVMGGKVERVAVFVWDPQAEAFGDFVETGLTVVPDR